MKHEQMLSRLGPHRLTLAAAFLAACASGKSPKPDAETARAIAEAYGAGAERGANSAAGGSDGGASASGGSAIVAPGGAGAAPDGDADPDEPDEDAPRVPVEPEESDESFEPAPEVEACDAFPILQEACGSSGCHGEGSNLGNFVESEAVARTFIGVGARLTCAGAGPIIDPENPSESVLVLKLSEDPICGNYMPPSRQFLSAEEIECVEAWMKNLSP